MKILIVEDDRKIAAFLTKGFREAGFVVDHAADGEAALRLASAGEHSVAVLDIMIPKRDGLSVLAELRTKNIDTPVIILSAKRSTDDRIKGLQAGGDDYLTKPFSFSELLARVQALIRRNTRTTEPTSLAVKDLSLDLLTRVVTRSGKKIELQSKEFSLLEYFMRNPERVLSKTMIMERVWDYDFDPQTNVVDVLVCRLRNKIDKDFDQKMIHTLRGVGYVIRVD